MKFSYPQRVELANVPTPIQYLKRLSEHLRGPDIFVKRDDLTGLGLTGNKVRKLEFLASEGLHERAEILITCGGVQSNHARATAVAAAKLGLKSHLLLRTTNGPSLDGNLFIDRLVDAEITFITREAYERVDDLMADLARDYAEQGKRAYVIPEGGSNALGAMGYIAAIEELVEQMARLSLDFDIIVSAVGSGGTLAGMLIGQRIHELKAEICGINVCDDAEFFRRRIAAIAAAWNKRFAKEPVLAEDEINIIDGYVGKGYGLSRREELDAIKLVARLEGIFLDPVYTGKAMYGLFDLIESGKIKKNARVLFWHTGGAFGIFPKRNLFF